ncbi:MAG: amino acid permease [Alphaproteobacteria bacterium RIFCSPLOWO2_01_FULL_40_26]|nr:MAG: amino acid permease [Alphaproteobacteria bacterium RIFCSPHIGHO2_02_FULL_40_34]OFW95496.1 MAG: amino acid permease [Alphaproteobacteria bacterium RIFCSPLOWO2_01_FULL_40_26]OFX09324.1 MAG: amino acid permease [Alphaproteobacteria bacterium RIFCSPLOWO2_02_FULL_40_19]OFX10855.1 MAG: amino acid permease [Alphaproteobacteria bacterium RIFCSPLOWO2_12_FULL_40_11]
MTIFRKKNISQIIADAEKNTLKKTLNAFDLILLGIGCTIGTGIFVVTGIAAAKYGGPAVSLSYVIAALACVFAGLAYAELASMVPVSGSAYTYSYVVMGEFVAWLVGWGLILEYAIGAATVASGWSGYIVGILKSVGIIVPEIFANSPASGGIINLPAVVITLFIGFLLYRGTKESITLNRVLVATKLGVIFLFLMIATPMIKTENYAEFFPFGFEGVIIGAATVFYAYIGFDCVATAAEECKNPKRDLPIGIIGSLIVCTILYVAVSLVLTGIVHFSTLNNAEPLARALRENGSNIGGALVATGAIAGITSVLLVLIYGQSRIFFVMSRDGMIPSALSKLHKKFNTPHLSVMLTSFSVATISGLFPLETLSHMTSLGTLFAFSVVAIGVLILRFTEPKIHRSFKCPAVYITVPLAVLSCGYLIYTLLLQTGLYFMLWSLLGLAVYFGYGYHNSPLVNRL